MAREGGGDAAAVLGADLRALAGPPLDGEPVEKVPCGHIDRSPFQARRVFPEAATAALRESVRANGLLQPVVLRPRPGGRFELIAGERRLRSVESLGWSHVTAVVRVVDDLTAHLLGQVENDDRTDISAWERALGFVDLRAHIARARGGIPTLSEIGEVRGGVDKSTVSRYLTIGEAFAPPLVARAGVTEEDMAALSLPTLIRAARRPEAHRFTHIRDVLRKRQIRAERARHRKLDPQEAGSRAPEPTAADRAKPTPKWEDYFRERAVRIETPGPAREMTTKQAHAAALRMILPLAALAARVAEAGSPTALVLEGDGGRIIYLPELLDGAVLTALERLKAALGADAAVDPKRPLTSNTPQRGRLPGMSGTHGG
nr:ParB/RepB/Spo0J family partition protein [Longimicrobium terrae]